MVSYSEMLHMTEGGNIFSCPYHLHVFFQAFVSYFPVCVESFCVTDEVQVYVLNDFQATFYYQYLYKHSIYDVWLLMGILKNKTSSLLVLPVLILKNGKVFRMGELSK